MATAEAEALARIATAQHRQLLGIQQVAGQLVGQTWARYANLDEVSAIRFTESAARVVDAAKMSTSNLAVAYMRTNDQLLGFTTPEELVPAMPFIRQGVPTIEVYQRSIVEARRAVHDGVPWGEAMQRGHARAVATARTDVMLANKQAIDVGGQVRPWVVGYRRILTGRSCLLCATASTQRYKRANLQPIHTNCDCTVGEIIGTADPGRVINQPLLDQLKESGASDELSLQSAAKRSGQRAEENRARAADWRREAAESGTKPAAARKLEDRAARYEQRAAAQDRIAAKHEKNLRDLRAAKGGSTRYVETVEHGDLGPVLKRSAHDFTDVDDLADAAEEITPIRVRAPKLTAEHPDVIAVAGRNGVTPDEVMTARARLGDVRRAMYEDAARVQVEAMREMEAYDTFQIRRPPKAGAKTAFGRSARGGEYDFLEQLDPAERARLSRKWYSDSRTDAPDVIHQKIHAVNPAKAESVDGAMQTWLDLNRRSEAAGAVRRGRIPAERAYSGAVDVGDLAPTLREQGYDVMRLLDDDLEAAGHIASVERDLLQREAEQYLGDALNPIHGPAPHRMAYESWADEVRSIEFEMDNYPDDVTDVMRARYRELVPEFIDEPGTSFEELHARIVSTARQAGEEIADDVAIQWADSEASDALLEAASRVERDAERAAREVAERAAREAEMAEFVTASERRAAAEATEAAASGSTVPPLVAGHITDVRKLLTYDSPKAEAKFGPTMEKLSKLHAAADDGLDITHVVAGSKTERKGGHFATGKKPAKPKRTKNKSRDQWLSEMKEWRDAPGVSEIRVNDMGKGEELLAFIHEYGHRLDYLGRSPTWGGGGRWASNDTLNSSAFRAFFDGTNASPTIRDAYKNSKSGSAAYVGYFRSSEEQWARAYSQWAAEKLGGAERAALEAYRDINPNYQWSDDEFRQIAPLVEAVLRERGLLA